MEIKFDDGTGAANGSMGTKCPTSLVEEPSQRGATNDFPLQRLGFFEPSRRDHRPLNLRKRFNFTVGFDSSLGTLPLTVAVQTVPLARMKHSGRARQAAFKIIVISLIAGMVVWALIAFGTVMVLVLGAGALAVTPFVIALWALFAVFTLYFSLFAQ